MKISRKQITYVCIIQTIFLVICCLLCTMLHISDAAPELMSILTISVGSILIFLWLKEACSNFSCSIIFGGYILRIICLLVDLYGRNYVTILHSGGDSEGFWAMAAQYYNNDYSGFYTWYPYVLRGFFSVFGQNRIIAQYINIVFWIFAVFVILKICDQFHISEHNRIIACGLMAFFPNNVFLSSVLMRESMMIFLDLWGMYFLIRWMKTGKWTFLLGAFLVPIPAIILHTASIGMWTAFAFVVAIWNKKKQRYMISMKTGIVLAGFAVLVCILYFTDLKALFMHKFDSGLSIYAITHRHFRVGGSDYLTNMDYQHWYELVPFTLVRMFYFVCSPMLTECRGLKDYFCVFGDVLPTLYVILSICFNMRKKKFLRYALVGVFSYVITVGIFAWGTANAGTALRHRGLLWGVLIATYCIGFGREGGQ